MQQYEPAPMQDTQYQPIQQEQPSYQTIGKNQQEYVNMNEDADGDFDEDENGDDFDDDEGDELEGFGGYGAMGGATYLPALAVAGAVFMVTAPSAKTKKAQSAAIMTSLGIGALFFFATSMKNKNASAGW